MTLEEALEAVRSGKIIYTFFGNIYIVDNKPVPIDTISDEKSVIFLYEINDILLRISDCSYMELRSRGGVVSIYADYVTHDNEEIETIIYDDGGVGANSIESVKAALSHIPRNVVQIISSYLLRHVPGVKDSDPNKWFDEGL